MAYRHMVKEVGTWVGTPEFRRKLIANLGDIYRMQVQSPAEMMTLGRSAFDHLKSVRPKNVEELRTYMRPHELSKVSSK